MGVNTLNSWRDVIPVEQRRHLWQRLQRVAHPAWLGTLHRTQPLGVNWGHDRGTPIDRYYIENFLNQHRDDIRGCVLEIKDSGYTERFGVGVTRRDVLDIDARNPHATFIADLARAESVPPDSFNCFIFSQTLQFIYDPRAAVSHIHRVLKPGGVLLATLPGICRVERAYAEMDYWRFTPASGLKLFAEQFHEENVVVRAYGNVLAATAFLNGMAREELSRAELEQTDPYFPVIVAARAVKRL